MNRRDFLCTPAVFVLPGLQLATKPTTLAPPAPPKFGVLYQGLIDALRATGLYVNPEYPLGSPGTITPAPNGKQCKVFVGGSAFIVDLGGFKMGKFDPMDYLEKNHTPRRHLIDRMVRYISERAAALGKPDVYMWPGSIAVEPDFTFDSGKPEDVIAVGVTFGLA